MTSQVVKIPMRVLPPRRLFALGLVLLLTGCGDPSARAPAAAPSTAPPAPTTSPAVAPEERDPPGDLEAPPPVTVSTSEMSIQLHAWTYCYRDGCADGAPPRNPPDLGDPTEVRVDFPLADWSFRASFTPAGEPCGRVQQVSLEETADGAFLLRPAGYAGTYDVTLFGRGDGDLFVTFRWTTPTDGSLPKPKARTAILADHDDTIDSYGIELHVSNLAKTPEQASAKITVESRDGDALTFEATRARTECQPEGTLYWDGPDSKGLEAARLGEAPFTYQVELVLDGSRYVARATWPSDEIRGNEPSVSLDFNPELPALTP